MGRTENKEDNEPSIILSREWIALTPQTKNNNLYFLTALDKMAANSDEIGMELFRPTIANIPQTCHK